MIMPTILDRMLEFHLDPKLLVTTTEPLTDKEMHPTVIGRFVEEDANGWFVRQDGKYILYCAKESKAMPQADPQKNLEYLLQETWGRYTRKRLNPDLDYGYKC